MRIPIIAGNWKMHKTMEEAVHFVRQIREDIKKTDREVVLCVPYTNLLAVKKEIEGTNIKLAAQNLHWEDYGAFTGEISPLMLKEIGIDYCIIGHSERRQYFNETDQTVNKKVHTALNHGIRPIVCVGETLDQREKDETQDRIKAQVIQALKGVNALQIKDIVLAYEPIWAIGTGKTATPEQANEVIAWIRKNIQEIFGASAAETVRIQYGGSVKPGNISAIMAQKDVDGVLIGGASLKPDDFIRMVNF